MTDVIYIILFFGLQAAGLILYRRLLIAMAAARVASPPSFPLFFVFVAYGAVLLFVAAECCRVWSGMHSLGLVGLFVVGIPWMFVQGFLWRRTWAMSAYHRVTITLSFMFPVALALLFGFASAIDF